MLNIEQKKSLVELKAAIERYKNGRTDIETLHKLRVQSRRTLSLLHNIKKCPLYNEVKEIIGQSNAIRDIDVMMSATIEKLPPNLKESLLSSGIKESFLSKKELLEKPFLEYISLIKLHTNSTQLKVPPELKKEEQECMPLFKIPNKVLGRLSSEQLHKLRIKAKKARYYLEAHAKESKEEIAIYKNIQEKLGVIHDNDVFSETIKQALKGKNPVLSILKKELKKENDLLLLDVELALNQLRALL